MTPRTRRLAIQGDLSRVSISAAVRGSRRGWRLRTRFEACTNVEHGRGSGRRTSAAPRRSVGTMTLRISAVERKSLKAGALLTEALWPMAQSGEDRLGLSGPRHCRAVPRIRHASGASAAAGGSTPERLARLRHARTASTRRSRRRPRLAWRHCRPGPDRVEDELPMRLGTGRGDASDRPFPVAAEQPGHRLLKVSTATDRHRRDAPARVPSGGERRQWFASSTSRFVQAQADEAPTASAL
jgi:hypothetical protein